MIILKSKTVVNIVGYIDKPHENLFVSVTARRNGNILYKLYLGQYLKPRLNQRIRDFFSEYGIILYQLHITEKTDDIA